MRRSLATALDAPPELGAEPRRRPVVEVKPVVAESDAEGRAAADMDEVAQLGRIAQGDAQAMRHLVQRYQDRIYGFCCRMLGESSEAEDLAQEVFLTVYRFAGSFRGDARVSTWIYRIAKNQALNRIKYLDRRGRGQGTALHALREEPVDETHAPDRIHADRQLRARVHEALEELEPDSRAVVVLRDLEGLTYEEIEEITGLPKGTVKSRIHRGRSQLASRMQRWVKDG